MLGVQGRRVPLFERVDQLAAISLPVLIIAGDEDDATLELALFLKRTIPRCGLVMLAKTGHTINLEEPAAFNAAVADFLQAVEHGRWGPGRWVGDEAFTLMPPEARP
jgi:pimeloyl-ACP methyl ester carboxylesterase